MLIDKDLRWLFVGDIDNAQILVIYNKMVDEDKRLFLQYCHLKKHI